MQPNVSQHERTNPINDSTETTRKQRLIEINLEPGSRQALESKHGRVWTTEELSEEFVILGFMAPYIGVERKSDGEKGSMEFQHSPRFYFNFVSRNEQ